MKLELSTQEFIYALGLFLCPSPIEMMRRFISKRRDDAAPGAGEEGSEVMDIAQGSIGPETTYDVEFKSGIADIKVQFKGAEGSAAIELTANSDLLIQAVEKKLKLSGVELEVLEIVRTALKA